MSGFLHRAFAEALTEFGVPRELRRCGAWVLERPIPGCSFRDAMGCYPLFCCKDWSKLQDDLEDIALDLVSLSLVTDPFGAFNVADLRRCFDLVKPFKEHYVVDLTRPLAEFVSPDHQTAARKAYRRGVNIEIVQDPLQYLEDWVRLYDGLKEKYGIRGIKAFSRTAFAKLLTTPGLVMLRAEHQGATLGLHLVFVQNEAAYNFLGAYSDAGYRLRASSALYLSSIEYFSQHVHWLDLGGGSGTNNDGTDGLSRFKMGWSNGSRTAYLCGRILDGQRYTETVKAKGITETDYFPAYRRGEL